MKTTKQHNTHSPSGTQSRVNTTSFISISAFFVFLLLCVPFSFGLNDLSGLNITDNRTTEKPIHEHIDIRDEYTLKTGIETFKEVSGTRVTMKRVSHDFPLSEIQITKEGVVRFDSSNYKQKIGVVDGAIAELSFYCAENYQTYALFRHSDSMASTEQIKASGQRVGSALCLDNSVSFRVSSFSSYLVDVAEDVVAYYKLDETSGTTASDSAGSNDITLTSSSLWDSGKINGGIKKTGSEYAYSDFHLGTSDFTLNLWHYERLNNQVSYPLFIASNINDWFSGNKFWIYKDDNGFIRTTFREGSSSQNVQGSIALNENSWNMITITRVGNVVKLYVNGVLDDSGSNTFFDMSFTSSFTKYMGRTPTGTSGDVLFFHNDEVLIADVEFTAQEVEDLYNAQKDGLESGQYPFQQLDIPEITLTLNGVSDNISLLANESLTVITQDLNNTGTLSLFRNGVNVTNENNTPVFLGAGTFLYEANTTLTENFTASSLSYTATITKSSQRALTLLVNNNNASAQTYFSNEGVVVSFIEDNVSAVPFTLTRNGVSIIDEIGLNITLASGTYTYTLTVTENDFYENYTQTRTITILQDSAVGGVFNFDWNMDSELKLFSCPTNPLQFGILLGFYVLVFTLFLSGLATPKLFKPVLMGTAGFIGFILPFYLVGCSMILASLLWIISLVFLFSALIVKFDY